VPRKLLSSGSSETLDSSTRPYSLLGTLQKSAGLLEQVLYRQAEDVIAGKGEPAPEQPNDPALEMLTQMISALSSGQGLDHLKPKITQLLSGQGEQSELVNNLLVAHDVTRLPGYLKARFTVEKYLFDCLGRNDLTPAEALAFLKLTKEEIDIITQRVRGGATSVRDVSALVDKADVLNRLSEQQLVDKFSKTTAVGREILRKVGYRLTKLVGKPS
jgi:hypothetical protein